MLDLLLSESRFMSVFPERLRTRHRESGFTSMIALEAFKGERREIQVGRTAYAPLCKRLAQRGGMFEAVTGTGGHHQGVLPRRMLIDNEMAIRRHGVGADSRLDHVRGHTDDAAAHLVLIHVPLFRRRDRTIHCLRQRSSVVLRGGDFQAALAV